MVNLSPKGVPGLPSSIGFRSNGFNINMWTRAPFVDEKPVDRRIRAFTFVDVNWMDILNNVLHRLPVYQIAEIPDTIVEDLLRCRYP